MKEIIHQFDIAGLGLCIRAELYIPTQMPEADRLQLADELTPLTGQGFMKCVDADLRQDVRNHVCGSERVVVVREGGKPCAFVCSSLHQVEGNGTLYHLEGIIVDKQFQGSGFARRLLEQEIMQSGANPIGFHTQSEKMVGLGQKIADLNAMDALRYGGLIGTHDQQGVIDRHRYGNHSLYGDTERFRESAVKAPECDWERGDAVICVGPVRR
jgi:GNAT superfamily N-acetyltransferase